MAVWESYGTLYYTMKQNRIENIILQNTNDIHLMTNQYPVCGQLLRVVSAAEKRWPRPCRCTIEKIKLHIALKEAKMRRLVSCRLGVLSRTGRTFPIIMIHCSRALQIKANGSPLCGQSP